MKPAAANERRASGGTSRRAPALTARTPTSRGKGTRRSPAAGAALLSLFCIAHARAESLDFVAEHILEVPMDLRYLALPTTPMNIGASARHVQLGYARVAGGTTRADLAMVGLSTYRPLSAGTGVTFGAFYDRLSFSGRPGPDVLEPSFGAPPGLPERVAVDVTGVDGSGYHAGLFAAWARRFDGGTRAQFGLALERLSVARYSIGFDTTDLRANFHGSVDYAGTYDIVTPFAGYEWRRRPFGRWTGMAHAIASVPLPRVGFRGRLTGPGFDIDGDTDAAGNGVHIPDAYLGLGYVLEHASSGFRIDLGATLYSYLLEPVGHSQIDSPIYLTVSRSFD